MFVGGWSWCTVVSIQWDPAQATTGDSTNLGNHPLQRCCPCWWRVSMPHKLVGHHCFFCGFCRIWYILYNGSDWYTLASVGPSTQTLITLLGIWIGRWWVMLWCETTAASVTLNEKCFGCSELPQQRSAVTGPVILLQPVIAWAPAVEARAFQSWIAMTSSCDIWHDSRGWCQRILPVVGCKQWTCQLRISVASSPCASCFQMFVGGWSWCTVVSIQWDPAQATTGDSTNLGNHPLQRCCPCWLRVSMPHRLVGHHCFFCCFVGFGIYCTTALIDIPLQAWAPARRHWSHYWAFG